MATTKWTITKSEVLPVTALFFGKFVSVLKTRQKGNLMYQRSKCPLFAFFLSAGV